METGQKTSRIPLTGFMRTLPRQKSKGDPNHFKVQALVLNDRLILTTCCSCQMIPIFFLFYYNVVCLHSVSFLNNRSLHTDWQDGKVMKQAIFNSCQWLLHLLGLDGRKEAG